MNYYNEIDPYCCQWLRNLIAAGLIPKGDIDERDIALVRPSDLVGYVQCHFFAGIAGWSYALRLVGWPEDREVWTGSCPCQPFSSAGARKGFDDPRHLWPKWLPLIRERRPAVVFGEQVASAKLWLDAVRSDLEGSGYAFGAAILPAAGVGAPHRRERWWYVGHAGKPASGRDGGAISGEKTAEQSARQQNGSSADGFRLASTNVAHSDQPGLEGRNSGILQERPGECTARPSSAFVADADQQSLGRSSESRRERGFWDVEPNVGRVAHGVPARVAKLRAFGNAIVPQVAAEFIRAYSEIASG